MMWLVSIYLLIGGYVLWERRKYLSDGTLDLQSSLLQRGQVVGYRTAKFGLSIATILFWWAVLIGKWKVRNEKTKR